ncbi:MAG: SH3 domain-containing protein, partial [Clostridiales bacterium]|nr:SH3 domain-containing protein [Clostridiales bacterium]
MKKRIFSLILAISMAFLSCPISAFAATDSFADTLRKQGFPETYISALTVLHNKYPNWNFKALNTNESFTYAVSQERKNHAQQLIEQYSVNDGKGYYCTCSSCYQNGKYIVKEKPNWVSASQSAVEYYMDPRNFLDEKYIFQFQLLDYDESQTQDGVEAILNGTWMYKSNITYKDKNGKTITYSPATKYSDAIMKAAEESGLSAYYLASKIVQEVGAASASNAGGSSGAVKGYEGIYNYYNLNAYSGATDGLKWASLSGYYTNTEGVNVRKGASTSTDKVVTVPLWTIVEVVDTVKGNDGYYWYNVSLTLNGKSYTGYIRSDLVAKDYYNRPWNNPYDSIVNGADYIKDSFGKTQNTGYLQKFNVNPDSSDRHSHEYMVNVSAATTEAYKTYTAFKGTNALSGKTTFLIPVYNNM